MNAPQLEMKKVNSQKSQEYGQIAKFKAKGSSIINNSLKHTSSHQTNKTGKTDNTLLNVNLQQQANSGLSWSSGQKSVHPLGHMGSKCSPSNLNKNHGPDMTFTSHIKSPDAGKSPEREQPRYVQVPQTFNNRSYNINLNYNVNVGPGQQVIDQSNLPLEVIDEIMGSESSMVRGGRN